MEKQEQKKAQSMRKRGRPAGQNRVPLSLKERRARNAQYEKERRIEQSEAISRLAEAADCEPNMSNSELLATVVNYLQRSAERSSVEDIDALRRCNGNLLSQIASLEHRLAEADTDSVNMSTSSSTCGSGENGAITIRTHANKRGRKKVKLTLEAHARSQLEPPSPPTSEFKFEAETDSLHNMNTEELVFTALDSPQFPEDPAKLEESSDRVDDFTKHWSIENFIVEYLR